MTDEKEKFGIGIKDNQDRLKYLYTQLKNRNYRISSLMKEKKQLEKEIRNLKIKIARQKNGIYLQGELDDEENDT